MGMTSLAMVWKRRAEAVSEAATDRMVLGEGSVSDEHNIFSSEK